MAASARANCFEQAGEVVALVDVSRPMQGDDEILTGNKLVGVPERGLLQTVDIREQGVDHGVADEEDAVFSDAALAQVVVGELAGREEPVSDRIGDEPVDLLGHAPVVGADARLDMRDLDVELLRGNGAGHRRGDIADNEAEVARGFEQQLFVADHDLRRLLGLSA